MLFWNKNKRNKGPFIIYGEGWAGKNEVWWGGGGNDQSRRLEEGVIMKYINKCGRPPNLLYTGNGSSNQNSAYIKKSHVNTENSHDIEKTMSQQCVQIEFAEEIV